MKKIFLVLILVAGFTRIGSAQPTPPKSDAAGIAVYPLSVRQAAQTALSNLDTLAKIAQLQSQSSAQFKALIATFPKATQEQIWKLIRYPKLIQEVVGGDVKDERNFPKDVQAIAKQLIQNNMELLNKINTIDDQPQKDFEALIAPLPDPARSAFQTLVQEPVVLNVLIKNLGLDQLNATQYQAQKKALQAKATQLSTDIQNASAPAPDKIPVAKGDNPQDIAKLQKAEDTLDQGLGYEQNIDPHGKPNAAQMNVSYSPYPFYNTYWGGFAFPLWYGWPGWYF